MRSALLVMAGGSLGALCRYGATLLSIRVCGIGFPWGTLAVNWAGCFFVGLAFALADQKNLITPSARLFLMTGFLGALTTFSTFALETVGLARPAALSSAVLNLIAHNAGGLVLVLAGMWLVRALS